MSNLSDNIKNGQLIKANVGNGALLAGQLTQIGGPGNELWPVGTTDYASVPAVTTSAVSHVGTNYQAVNNYYRWPIQYDALGDSYVATPNASGQGVAVTKYSPAGVQLATAVLDSTVLAMSALQLLTLSNNTFCAVYAIASTGAIRFLIFDAQLSIIVAPTAVATGYEVGSVAYLSAVTMPGISGFGIVYQNAGHTAIDLQTYSNAGAAITAATSIQALGATALCYLKLGLLSNGNLVCAMRYSTTGTSFVVVGPTGTGVVANTVVDATNTAGFLELSVLTGFFAIADMNGTNVTAAVYNNAGAKQGSTYTGGSTLNSSTYAQIRMVNDGTYFYLVFTATAGGIFVVQLTQAGGSSIANASAFEASEFTTTSSLDVAIANNLLFVFSASTTTGGQAYTVIGLPDAALTIDYPYIYAATVSVGSAAGTTGSYWPTCRATGDFTAQVVYDQQTTSGMFYVRVKFAASAITGIAQAAVAAYAQGTVNVNLGAGSYPTQAPMTGTSGLPFDHSGGTPAGNKGVLYANGVTLFAPVESSTGYIGGATGTLISTSVTYTASTPTQVNVYMESMAGGSTLTINGGPDLTGALSQNSNGFYNPMFLAAGQTMVFTVGSFTGTIAVFAQKVA